jgi:2-hydroxymuconate-semialdehyde hydrolase
LAVIDIPVTGATISLEDTGEGVPVLLLHGFPATHHLWSRVAPLMKDAGFRLLIPDLVGYGAADAPAGVRLDMASQARWMLAMLDVLGIERVALVAHDVGSAAAQLMVTIAPHRVGALVVLDGVYADEWAMEAIASIQAWDPAEASRLFPVLARRVGKSAALREMLTVYEGELGGLRLIRAARDLDPSQTAHIGEALRSSGIPALVIWGDNDVYLPLHSVAQPLADLLRADLLILPGGHFTPLDCPDEVAAALVEFLALRAWS